MTSQYLLGYGLERDLPELTFFLNHLLMNYYNCMNRGMNWTLIFPIKGDDNVKVNCILPSTDFLARAKLHNMTRFNGNFGCPYCYNKGKIVRKGKTRIPWYQHKKVDRKLLMIKPPTEVTRLPASIQQRRLWKASFWMANFLNWAQITVHHTVWSSVFLLHILFFYTFQTSW